MAEPIQSRCILKRIISLDKPTWRQKIMHKKWSEPDDTPVPCVETPTTLDELREVRLIGADPYVVMMQIAKGTTMETEVMKRSTMGMSPWLLSAWVLSNKETFRA